jgi:WD40 repeat protein
LEENELPLKEICDEHSEFTQYYCMECRHEICSFCISKGGKHNEHKYIPFSKFRQYTKEIRDKLKFKTLEECEKNLELIRTKKDKEKKDKINTFLNKIEELINNIKIAKDSYVKNIEEKMNDFNKVIDLVKESYKYYYNLLNNEKQDFYTLDYLNKITEILDIQTIYANFDELIEAIELISKFSKKKAFLYRINTNDMPSPYTFDSFTFNKFKRSVKSKFNFGNIKEIKYEKKINILINSIYAITKINDKNGLAIASGNDILVIEDIYNYDPNNPETMSGHSKSINSLVLMNENKLASGSEDKTIKIWDIQKRLCISTITGNYERIQSLLKINENTLAAGSQRTIRVFNIDNKKELFNLEGHEKGVCTMIKLNENKMISGGFDNLIKIWDINEKCCEYTLYGHDTTVFVVLLLQDGRLASGSGSWDRALKIWDLENKRCDCTLTGHKREIKCMQQLSNGWLLTGSVDKTVKVWNVKKKCCIQTLVSHFDAVNSLCIIDKEKFVTGGKDQEIIIWKI